MSTTYSFVCDDCKIQCWCGQSGYIYKYKYIAKFLNDHLNHRLRYLPDGTGDESEDYEEIEEAYTHED